MSRALTSLLTAACAACATVLSACSRETDPYDASLEDPLANFDDIINVPELPHEVIFPPLTSHRAYQLGEDMAAAWDGTCPLEMSPQGIAWLPDQMRPDEDIPFQDQFYGRVYLAAWFGNPDAIACLAIRSLAGPESLREWAFVPLLIADHYGIEIPDAYFEHVEATSTPARVRRMREMAYIQFINIAIHQTTERAQRTWPDTFPIGPEAGETFFRAIEERAEELRRRSAAAPRD